MWSSPFNPLGQKMQTKSKSRTESLSLNQSRKLGSSSQAIQSACINQSVPARDDTENHPILEHFAYDPSIFHLLGTDKKFAIIFEMIQQLQGEARSQEMSVANFKAVTCGFMHWTVKSMNERIEAEKKQGDDVTLLEKRIQQVERRGDEISEAFKVDQDLRHKQSQMLFDEGLKQFKYLRNSQETLERRMLPPPTFDTENAWIEEIVKQFSELMSKLNPAAAASVLHKLTEVFTTSQEK